LCAGITVYSPLKHFGAGPGKKVGIIGIGGLGHLGLKYARALGAEVYAISTSASKEEESKKLGAQHFINTKDKESVAKVSPNPNGGMKLRAVTDEEILQHENALDLIVCTLNGDVDWKMYVSLLRRDGQFVIVGVPETKLQLPAFSLIAK
jgi:uncharacterized zinc-type alcohol dehydrogenase-like protein